MALDTKNYVFGRGKLYFNRFADGTTDGSGERYFGNTTEFNITVESTTLDHFDSDEGVNVKDASVQTELNRTGTMITDNIADENVALFVLGDISDVVQTATPVAGEVINGGAVLVADHWYQLGTTGANPTGVRGVTAVTITGDPSGTPAVGVAGTDYILDAALGRFQVVEGGVLDGVDADADYTPDANTRRRVATSADPINGSMRFIATNPQGKYKDVFIPWVQLTANGDWALKGDDWQNLGFNLSVNQLVKDGTTYAQMYVEGRPE